MKPEDIESWLLKNKKQKHIENLKLSFLYVFYIIGIFFLWEESSVLDKYDES